MATPPLRRQINVEDYEAQYGNLINQLAQVLNPFLNDTSDAFEKSINFDNLEFNIISLQVNIGTSGEILSTSQVNVGIINPLGTTTISARNTTNPTSYPTGTPFISYTPIGNGIVEINNISNLTAGTWNLNVIVY